jgi:nicotinamide-nucleotide amidase
VSQEVALAMVDGALKNSRADVAVAITGIAGPDGGSEQKPVGLVHIAAAKRGGARLHEEHRFGDIGRKSVQTKSATAALSLVQKLLD